MKNGIVLVPIARSIGTVLICQRKASKTMTNQWGWIPCDKINPLKPGAYLVTTAHGKIRIDRWDGEMWAMCNPANKRGRYKLHRAFTYLPKPYGR